MKMKSIKVGITALIISGGTKQQNGMPVENVTLEIIDEKV